MCGKHFSQGLKGRERIMKRIPPKIRRPPAEPMQVTDHESSWCRGMEWSLDSRDTTDWWNIRMERRTSTPAHRDHKQLFTKPNISQIGILPHLNVEVNIKHSEVPPDRMKQKEAGLIKKGTPLLRAIAIQMEPITIMVRLRRAKIDAARFSSVKESHNKLKEKKD